MTSDLDNEAQDSMATVMKDWQQRRRGGTSYATSDSVVDSNINIPLSQGEWDEPLGLPLCVVCHGVRCVAMGR